MSPRKRFGHTSSPWRHERGAECRTSSSSCRDGISPVTHVQSSSSSVFVPSVCFESCMTCVALTASECDSPSAILCLKYLYNSVLSLLLGQPAGCCSSQMVTVTNRVLVCALAQAHKFSIMDMFINTSVAWKQCHKSVDLSANLVLGFAFWSSLKTIYTIIRFFSHNEAIQVYKVLV